MRETTRKLIEGFKRRNEAFKETEGIYADLREQLNRADRANVYWQYKSMGYGGMLRQTILKW